VNIEVIEFELELEFELECALDHKNIGMNLMTMIIGMNPNMKCSNKLIVLSNHY